MTALSQHKGSKQIRALYLGLPTKGKTGSLTSLVAAGYKLRILDFDNKLSVLKHFVNEQCPDKMGNIDAETLRDKYRATSGGIQCSSPKAFTRASELMTKWSDGTVPAEWGLETIFVIDSLSSYGQASLNWATALNPSAKDARNWYWTAQKGVESQLALCTSEDFGPHMIAIAHIKWDEDENTSERKGYANVVGSALGPLVGRYFNLIIMADTVGAGPKTRRIIRTVNTNTVDLITPAPFKIEAELPLESGLATLFAQLTTHGA